MSDTIESAAPVASPAAPAQAATSAPSAAPAIPTTIASTAPVQDWRSGLSDDLKNAPSLKDIKDVQSLAKGYVHAQSLVGGDRLAVPKEGATPAEMDAFYAKLGRPEKADGYKFSDKKLPDGWGIDEKVQGKFTDVFHKAGLNNKQADQVRGAYLDHQVAERNEMIEQGEKALMAQWGDNYQKNASIATKAIGTFASPGLVAKLERTGLGSDPDVVLAFHNIGLKMLEDSPTQGGQAATFGEGSVQHAQGEINKLTKDAEFQKALHDRYNPKHAEVAKKWVELHQAAAVKNP